MRIRLRESGLSSADARTVQPASWVTCRAFFRFVHTADGLAALVDWRRRNQQDAFNRTAALLLRGELWLVYSSERGYVSELLIGPTGVGRNYSVFKTTGPFNDFFLFFFFLKVQQESSDQLTLINSL